MKIAFLSRYQDKNQRGAESFVFELSKRLSKDHQVAILKSDSSDSIKEMIAGRYDVIIPMNGRLQGIKASLSRLVTNHKLVITGQSGIGRDDILNITIAQPNVFVALTGYMEHWAKKWSINSKIVKIPNGVDLNRFSPKGEKIHLGLEKPVILSVGALEEYKNHEYVIRAVSKLGKGSLVIVGRGSLFNYLNELGNKLLVNRFKVIELDYNEMPKIYRSADIFTLPSWNREAFGIVYLEAMATNLPVVAPNDKSRREIVENGGLFTDVQNIGNYAESLNQALSITWKNKPLEQAEKFSWDIIAQKYDNLFRSL